MKWLAKGPPRGRRGGGREGGRGREEGCGILSDVSLSEARGLKEYKGL